MSKKSTYTPLAGRKALLKACQHTPSGSNQVMVSGKVVHQLLLLLEDVDPELNLPAPAPSSSLLGEGPTHTSDEPLESHVGVSSARPEAFQFTDNDIRQRLTKIAADGKGVFLSQHAAKQVAEMLAAPALLSSGGPAADSETQTKLDEDYPEPEYHAEGMGCGLEDAGIYDRYEAMQHGWQHAITRMYNEVVFPQRAALLAEIKALRAAPVSTSLGGGAAEPWIRVDERLPEDHGHYDFATKSAIYLNGYWGSSRFNDGEWYYAEEDDQPPFVGIKDVTHWRKLRREPNPNDAAADQLLVDSSGAGPQFVPVTAFDQVKNGDSLLIVGNIDGVQQHLFHNVTTKESAADGQEIILKKKGNKFFNFGMYLGKQSWVKQCYKLQWPADEAH